MTQPDPVELASMLCSRLCHDLLSPVGAMTNGLELLADETDPEMRDRCLELLAQSAKTSADKLKFFRLAFGAAGGFGDRVPMEEPKAAIDALVGDNKRIEVKWALAVDSLPKPAVKVLLNLSHIALDALMRGGTLDIGAERNNGASEIVVRAAGKKIAFDDTIGLALQGDLNPAELSGRTAPAWMVGALAEKVGGSIQFHRSEETLLLGAVLPEGEGMIG
ncbi:histidine phosphotransferase family protein [Qipengyuania sp. DSG2-2]|uniref:histidine phosphotransferase family protein n=1 Tax=Qipengyuania sp. DGS2-2 TaxID=3349631 RepID=UPI0036D3569D